MREKKKVLKNGIILIVIFTILVVSLDVTIKVFSNKNQSTNKEKMNYDSVKIEGEINKDLEDTETEEIMKNQEEVSSVIVPEEKENIPPVSSNNNSASNNSSSNKQTTKPSSSKNDVTTPPIKEEPKKVEIWEKLGVSEYDYYNTPANGWSIDVPVASCKNRENCVKVCQEKANTYLDSFSSGRYRCTSLNSHSGNYLGEHISYFDLES